MLKEIIIAFESWNAARRFIQQHKLIKWILIPGLIYSFLFIIGMLFFWQSSDGVWSWVSRQLNIEPWLQKERSPWLSFLFVMTGVMVRITSVLFYFSFFKYFILIIGSPVFAYLSEKTEAILEGKEHSINSAELKKDCIRGIKQAMYNCGWQSVYLIALLFLSLVPVVGWVTPVFALLMESYYFGFSMLDYSLARAGYNISQSRTIAGNHKGLAIGNGIIFYIMHCIIVLAPAYAIIAGTLSVNKVKNS